MSTLPIIKREVFELLDSDQASSELDGLIGAHDELGQLFSLTTAAGFADVAGSAHGWKYTAEAAAAIGPDEGESGNPVDTFTSQATFRGYTNRIGAAPSLLAVGTVSMKAGANEHVEHLQLEAPNADINYMVERKVEGSGLVVVDGWWDRFRGCLGGCGGVGRAALGGGAGAGALPAILACLAVRCGGCAARCAACATCDCRWWCKWAAKCCRG